MVSAGRCEGYARYLEQNGVKVDVEPTNDLDAGSDGAALRRASRCWSSTRRRTHSGDAVQKPVLRLCDQP
jgi:hypothetical protein